jgi:hypothetical protein
MTAVEWLVKELGEYLPTSIKDVQSMIEEAKELEKQQIIDFAEDYEMWESEKYPRKTFKQYYKETYGDK